jgi:Cu2+-containing amine oxidase
MLDPVEMQERYEAVMMRQLKEHGIFEGVVAMFNAKQAEIERLREALRQVAQCDFQSWAQTALSKNPDDQRQTLERIAQYDMQKIAIDALGEDKE